MRLSVSLPILAAALAVAIAVLVAAHPDGFAILLEDGIVELFQMPKR